MSGMSRSETARERWSRIIREQRESGESVGVFCARCSIPTSSLFAWKRKLGSMADQRPAPSGFVEAQVRGVGDGHGGGVTIQLGCGRSVVVSRGFDRLVLLEVIAALESGGGS